MNTTQIGTFEETFGDNKGTDAWFSRGDSISASSKKVTPFKKDLI